MEKLYNYILVCINNLSGVCHRHGDTVYVSFGWYINNKTNEIELDKLIRLYSGAEYLMFVDHTTGRPTTGNIHKWNEQMCLYAFAFVKR